MARRPWSACSSSRDGRQQMAVVGLGPPSRTGGAGLPTLQLWGAMTPLLVRALGFPPWNRDDGLPIGLELRLNELRVT